MLIANLWHVKESFPLISFVKDMSIWSLEYEEPIQCPLMCSEIDLNLFVLLIKEKKVT